MLRNVLAPAIRSSPHDGFLPLMPIVVRHAHVVFRRLPPSEREECACEAVAAAFLAYLSLTARGRDPFQFPSVLATRAAQHVQADRHVGGHLNRQDVLSRAAQRSQGFAVQSLDQLAQGNGNAWWEAVTDNARTPPDEAAAFRVDFPDWLRTRTDRDRCLIRDLAAGERPTDVADHYGLSRGRISQLRREYEQDWLRFQGELPAQGGSPRAAWPKPRGGQGTFTSEPATPLLRCNSGHAHRTVLDSFP
jgi:hypothetical protein